MDRNKVQQRIKGHNRNYELQIMNYELIFTFFIKNEMGF